MGYAWIDSDEEARTAQGSRAADASPSTRAGRTGPKRSDDEKKRADSPDDDQLVGDVGDLVRSARIRPSAQAIDAVWARVLGLRTWFLLAEDRGDPSQRTPRVIERNGRRSVLVFTDELGAVHHQFAAHAHSGATRGHSEEMPPRDDQTILAPDPRRSSSPHSKQGPHQPAGASTKPLPPMLDAGMELELGVAGAMMERLAKGGVFSATFDIDDEAFEVPLGVLLPLHPRLEGDRSGLAEATQLHGPPAGRIDFALLFEKALRQPASRSAALESLLGLKDWWFICNPRQPDAIFVRRVGGSSTLMVFTDQRRAIAATRRLGVVDAEGTILLLQLAVSDAIEWLSAFVAEGVEQMAFDAADGGGLPAAISEVQERWRSRTKDD